MHSHSGNFITPMYHLKTFVFQVETKEAGKYISAKFMTLSTRVGTLGAFDFGTFKCVAEGESASASGQINLVQGAAT